MSVRHDYIRIAGAWENKLKGVLTEIPRRQITVFTGVSGAGKSSIVFDTIANAFSFSEPEGLCPGCNGLGEKMTLDLEKLLDRGKRLNDGACPECEGPGDIYIEVPFMDPLKSTCEACGGRRYKEEALHYTLRQESISGVLGMTVSEALE